MAKTVLILNGPNLNMLGLRQPEIYGRETLADVEQLCQERGSALGLKVDFRQSNAESELITWAQEARTKFDGLIVNAGGYSHTSIALMDALLACEKPVIEVHISNIFRRDQFRHHSYVSLAARGVICGLGPKGYALALEGMAELLQQGRA